MYEMLDIVFFLAHLVIILFNLFGWIWRRTRKLHIWCVGLTLGSWFILGIRHGFGYCFLTDWHWQVKRQLGETDLPSSFIQYLFEKIGIVIPPQVTDIITLCVFAVVVLWTIYLHFNPRVAPKC